MINVIGNFIGSITGVGNGGNNLPANFVPVIFDIGQSDAVGRAEGSRLHQLTQYPAIPSNVLIYNKPDYTITDNGTFQVINTQSGNCREPDQGPITTYGAFHPLGCLLASALQRKVYVIMMGDGGTALQQNLTNPDWSPASSGECFDIATARYYNVAYPKIQAAEPGKTLVPFIIWSQGETDATDNTATAAYPTNFTNFVPLLRATHASLATAFMYIRLHTYNKSANEATINAFFTSYAAATPSLYKVIDTNDLPRKVDLTTFEKGGIAPSTGADDNHASYLNQNGTAERIYSDMVTRFNLNVISEVTNNTTFNPSTITSAGIRLQFNKGNSTLDSQYAFTALTNNLSTGTFNTFVGTPVPKYKFDNNYKGWTNFVLGGGNARIASSAAIGTTLFSNSGGVSGAVWIRPYTGITAGTQTIFHDIQNTGSPTNSRCSAVINPAGTISVFTSITNTAKATTASPVFASGTVAQPIHLAFTYTPGDLIRIYINGVLVANDGTDTGSLSGVTLTNYVNNTNVFQLGATRTGASTYVNFFLGYMREFIIQPGVIWSAGQVTSIMSN